MLPSLCRSGKWLHTCTCMYMYLSFINMKYMWTQVQVYEQGLVHSHVPGYGACIIISRWCIHVYWVSLCMFPLCRNILKQLAAQGYRCTGCGMKQEPSQARHFRFCNYTGKYFCQKCHTNATSVIPAYIMDRWSFRKWAGMVVGMMRDECFPSGLMSHGFPVCNVHGCG